MNASSFNKSRVWTTAVHAALGAFIFGYNIGVFTSCQPCVAATLGWGSSTDLLVAIMTSLNYMGGFFGALCSGFLKPYGRRRSLMLADWVTVLGSMIVIIPFTYTFAIGRIILGFASGMFNSLCPLYINEKTPKQMSGKVGAVYQVFSCSGVLASYAVALMLPTGNYKSDPRTYIWMPIFACQGFIALAHFILFKTNFQLDTPTSLIDKGYTEKALESLCEIYNREDANSIMDATRVFNQKSTNTVSPNVLKMTHTYRQLLLCQDGRGKMMRIGIMTNFVMNFSGLIPILSYLTTLFTAFGGGVMLSRGLTTVSGVVKLVAVVAMMPFFDKFKRRTLFVFGSFFMAIFMGLVGLFNDYVIISYFVPFVCIEMFLIVFEVSTGPLCWIYSAEILCPKGMSIAIATNWIFMFLTTLSFPFMIELMGIGLTFFTYAVINMLCAVYCYIDFIETIGFDKQAIQAKLFDKD